MSLFTIPNWRDVLNIMDSEQINAFITANNLPKSGNLPQRRQRVFAHIQSIRRTLLEQQRESLMNRPPPNISHMNISYPFSSTMRPQLQQQYHPGLPAFNQSNAPSTIDNTVVSQQNL